MSPAARTRRPTTDAVLVGAVDLARAAAEDAAGGVAAVGEHLDVQVDGDRLVTHLFDCLATGYRGWRWSVTLARASRARIATIDESVLVPGPDAVVSPTWLPWSDRLRAGDLGPGDLLPTAPDDVRLEPGFTAVGADALAGGAADPGQVVDPALDPEIERIAVFELGLGRERVLSPIGRDDAIDRWYAGDRGPSAPIALAAPGPCSTCGFLVPMAGALRSVFGVCANEYAPDDGRVVSYDHGCGAHSQAPVAVDESRHPGERVLDDDVLDLEPAAEAEDGLDPVAVEPDAAAVGSS